MLLNIDETYKKIKNGTLTKEEKKKIKNIFCQISNVILKKYIII